MAILKKLEEFRKILRKSSVNLLIKDKGVKYFQPFSIKTNDFFVITFSQISGSPLKIVT